MKLEELRAPNKTSTPAACAHSLQLYSALAPNVAAMTMSLPDHRQTGSQLLVSGVYTH